ncbi:coenzyme Q biosynthesis protein Coq4-domain-containing protein [Phlebopus sp. FC_14]|nr:coenzyme Q biosynthesis protein Coq4-domain-containing protein [Phlebopus sp. FC_14]
MSTLASTCSRSSTHILRNVFPSPLALRSIDSFCRRHRTFFTNANASRTPAYPGHIPLSSFENAFLAVGSAVMALINPRRGDMVAALGETTAGSTLPKLRDTMLDSPEGRRILKDRPRINSQTLDIDRLKSLPDGTFGREYVRWLESCNVTPDSREPVHYISDPELAYVMQRYRETHDFYHALFALRVSALPELALKAFEFTNLGFPMTALALGASVKMKANQRERLWKEFVPWALKCGSRGRCFITVYWEERWEQNVEEIKRELGVWDPPAGVSIRPASS